MTAQISEILRYEGEELALCTEPLGDYFSLIGLDTPFEPNCTALWRGYVGTWEIAQSRLYLIGLTGTLRDGTDAKLASLFPGFPERVFAHWYTGTLRAPQGKLLRYVHQGYRSTHERDLLFGVTKGVVVWTNVWDNGTLDLGTVAVEGYRVGAMTQLPRSDHPRQDP
jgi:hypothetical protein